MNVELSDDDMARAVAFVDGAMTADERTSFELRLAAEPELAAGVEALMEADELVRRASVKRAGTVISLADRRRRMWMVAAASLAAAVLAALGITRFFVEDHASRIECAVALAPSFATADEFLASRPELAGMRPPGLDSLRGATDAPNVGAREFAARAHALEPRPPSLSTTDSPTSNSPNSITAGYFVVPIETKTSCSVVVIGIPQDGGAVRLYPDPADKRPSREQGRIEPGVHTLPRERIELASDGASVAYQRGFLVPVGARAMDVLVAVRSEPLDTATITAIDSQLARSISSSSRGASDDAHTSMQSELERFGFHVSTLRVIEPKD